MGGALRLGLLLLGGRGPALPPLPAPLSPGRPVGLDSPLEGGARAVAHVLRGNATLSLVEVVGHLEKGGREGGGRGTDGSQRSGWWSFSRFSGDSPPSHRAHLLALLQEPEAGALHGRLVHKHCTGKAGKGDSAAMRRRAGENREGCVAREKIGTPIFDRRRPRSSAPRRRAPRARVDCAHHPTRRTRPG